MMLGRRAGRQTTLDTRDFPAAARVVALLLNEIRHGVLTVRWPDGQISEHGRGTPYASIGIHDFEICSAVLKRGDIGFGESYMDGHWSADDLPALLGLFVANRDAIRKAIYGSVPARVLFNIKHWLRRNTVSQARRNIAAHYDLGNGFYRLWLDPGMTYSSALYSWPRPQPELTLEQAQASKYARIIHEARIGLGSKVLEIGCGWGGFAEAAAARGAQVTGLTLSSEQRDWALRRLDRAGLAGNTQILLQDYRHEHAQYDAIASVEMFEAVGEQYWPSYFKTVRECLKPGGRAVVQTITIDEELFNQYRSTPDFIQTYVFPGGMLPSMSAFRAQARRAGLKVVQELRFGHDYARTLALWRSAFMSSLPAVRAQGFDDHFISMWEFYLAYCEAAFAGDNTDVVQFTLEHAA
jgi:cyclopropane-fatty-acyl-phospholipid synthase